MFSRCCHITLLSLLPVAAFQLPKHPLHLALWLQHYLDNTIQDPFQLVAKSFLLATAISLSFHMFYQTKLPLDAATMHQAAATCTPPLNSLIVVYYWDAMLVLILHAAQHPTFFEPKQCYTNKQ